MLDLWGGYFCTLSSEADCECPLYRLIQKFEKTVVVFKKSLYNRVVAKAATLFVYNSSEHKQNEKTGYANWFAIGWIVIL